MSGMFISRTWAMPNKWTFTIKPIAELLYNYNVGRGWVDPFAGDNSPAEITNDINKEMPTNYHLPAIEFVGDVGVIEGGVLFDPPYSLRQIKECYKECNRKLNYDDTLDASFGKVKDVLAKKIRAGAHVISFGWSTNGFGKNRGFEIIEILLVPHGGHHNDTLVTVERKMHSDLFEEAV